MVVIPGVRRHKQVDSRHEANRNLWNVWTPIHQRSRLYGLDRFRAGESSLQPAEVELLGDVSGKSLLHLQCHFGMDTLSWARLGARVTGVDISDEAIELARRLAAEQALPARFIRCDIYDLPAHLDEQFDIVYTSYGVKAWLSDLPAWGRIIARYLRQTGRFYILEGHPFNHVFAAPKGAQGFEDLRITNSYFDRGPHRYETDWSYAMVPGDPPHKRTECFEWTHTMADIINALAGAGLRIERMQEYAEHPYQQYLLPVEDPAPFAGKKSPLPVVFALVAGKPASAGSPAGKTV
jgi:SAM-dependent methyltransferase